jgi:MFS family permease
VSSRVREPVRRHLLYPVLPIFLTQTLKASGSVVGLIDGFAQATQNIVQGFSGSLSDKLQMRKAIALAGHFLAAVAKPLMGLSTTWPGVFGAGVLDRVGAGTRSAPRDALNAASVAEAHRGRAFGLEGVGDNAGAFLGPLLAVFLLYTLHVDIRTIFYLAVFPGLLALLMVVLVTERHAVVAAKSKIDINLRQFPKSYWSYLLATGLFGVGNSSNPSLILRTQEITSLESTIYAAFNLVAALISYPAGTLSDAWGRRSVLGIVSRLPRHLSWHCHHERRHPGGGVICVVRSVSGDLPCRRKGAGLRLRTHLRASAIGWYNTVVGLLQPVASLVAGLLWDRVGYTAVSYYGAIFAAVGSIALLLLVPANSTVQNATADWA